jgi:hypothetical protein
MSLLEEFARERVVYFDVCDGTPVAFPYWHARRAA